MQSQNYQLIDYMLQGNTVDHISVRKMGIAVLNSRTSNIRAMGFNLLKKDNGKNYDEHYIDTTKKYGIYRVNENDYLMSINPELQVFTWTDKKDLAMGLRLKLMEFYDYLRKTMKYKIKVVEL